VRHLPPAATPIGLRDLADALVASPGMIDDFRRALTRYLGVRACFLAATGRAALYLLFETLQEDSLPARRQVVLPAYTCPSLVKVVEAANLVPRLVDIAPETMTYAPEELASAIGDETLAVVLVHPFGIPQEVGWVHALAREARATLIEDAAQSLGAKVGARRAGTVGDCGLFSLGPGKALSTGGGGIVCTQDAALAERLRITWQRLPTAGAAASVAATARLALMTAAFHPTGWYWAAKAGVQRVGESEATWGFALRPFTAGQAAVGTRLLPRLDAINRERRLRAELYRAALGVVPGVHVPAPSPKEALAQGAIYVRLPLLLENEERRDRLHKALCAAGIGAGRMYQKTLAEFFPIYAKGAYPGAEAVARRLLTLPTHHYVTGPEIERALALVVGTRAG
jgi:perosamine synthetase